MMHVIAFGMPSMGEWIVVAAIGLLFFGKRLPEVGRSLGKGIVEFKKGLKGIEDDIDVQVDDAVHHTPRITATTVAPAAVPAARFDPVTGQPLVQHVRQLFLDVASALELSAACRDPVHPGVKRCPLAEVLGE